MSYCWWTVIRQTRSGSGSNEEHKPKWRRLLKVAIILTVVVGLSATAGRFWAYAVMAIPLIGAAVIHIWWLPKHGSTAGRESRKINTWNS